MKRRKRKMVNEGEDDDEQTKMNQDTRKGRQEHAHEKRKTSPEN